MSRYWLYLHLGAPLMSFGAVAIDQIGPTGRWPGRAMLTGLLGNALGWDWTDRAAHAALQGRLVHATVAIREGEMLTDNQNAWLAKSDKGWTTRGQPEGRRGDSYAAPHRRRRDYLVDAELCVVLTLDRHDEAPTLEQLHTALLRPARPLFIGRKPCLPTRSLVSGTGADFIEADTAHAALCAVRNTTGHRASWPESEGPRGTRSMETADLRNWDSGLHGGARRIEEGTL